MALGFLPQGGRSNKIPANERLLPFWVLMVYQLVERARPPDHFCDYAICLFTIASHKSSSRDQHLSIKRDQTAGQSGSGLGDSKQSRCQPSRGQTSRGHRVQGQSKIIPEKHLFFKLIWAAYFCKHAFNELDGMKQMSILLRVLIMVFSPSSIP